MYVQPRGGTRANFHGHTVSALHMEYTHLVLLAIVLWFMYTRGSAKGGQVEQFDTTEARKALVRDSHASDVRFITGTVGGYVTDIYMYLRGKYHNTLENRAAPPVYIPTQKDASLADTALPAARAQIKAYITSWQAQMAKKYDPQTLASLGAINNLQFTDNADATLNVLFTHNGKTQTYLV